MLSKVSSNEMKNIPAFTVTVSILSSFFFFFKMNLSNSNVMDTKSLVTYVASSSSYT